jgi:hypothetical protein
MPLTEKILDGARSEHVKPIDLKAKPAAEKDNVLCIREGKPKKAYNPPVLRVYGRIDTAGPCRCQCTRIL